MSVWGPLVLAGVLTVLALPVVLPLAGVALAGATALAAQATVRVMRWVWHWTGMDIDWDLSRMAENSRRGQQGN